jgi:hypothetical protein
MSEIKCPNCNSSNFERVTKTTSVETSTLEGLGTRGFKTKEDITDTFTRCAKCKADGFSATVQRLVDDLFW